MTDQGQPSLRLDKWLWFARFYKTRRLATEAINGGHVQVNGERVKPSRLINIGDCVRIRRSTTTMTVDIVAAGERRGPASEAQGLYKEHQQSIEEREKLREQYKLNAQSQLRPAKKPDKRARRQLMAAKQRNSK